VIVRGADILSVDRFYGRQDVCPTACALGLTLGQLVSLIPLLLRECFTEAVPKDSIKTAAQK
jgi:hypothetical protein